MKKSIVFSVILFFCLTVNAFSQFGDSRAILTGVGDGRNVDFQGNTPCYDGETGFAGIIIATLDGVANTPFYCLDLCTGISIGDTAKDSASTIPQAIYITNNYYPELTSYPGKLASNNDEACAIQLAIWYFRNGLDVSTDIGNISGSNDAAIKTRVGVIIADVIANGGSTPQISTLEIKPGVNPDDFYIETKDTDGNPIAVTGIQLSISGTGSLSTNTVNTNASGISPDVTVTGASANDIISASGTVEVPGGVTYSGLNEVLQLLVLSRTTEATRTDQIEWGVLPVELTSFTANISGSNITLNWSTSEEINNSGYEVERFKTGINAWEKIGFVTGHGNSTVTQNYTYTDRNLTSGIYTYRLKQIDFNGNFEYFNLNGEVIVGVPNSFELSQNYPNPFNPETKINFQIPNESNVSLKVFDNSGKEVATLVNGNKTAGYHTVSFNASNLSSGIYFYKLEAEGFTKVMKMALVK
ncbi:MAG TPA: T9SS type A sorting domain-containing protein [Ignavibacteria bacterium]|nr:T9SS type A sorting domain-containing protein [Ignavibacteria bacterium]HRJ98922.1 T9SS type A sorting domain-containing protein [Ignavibacteria bacterium]